jgi:hypothetical protein
MSATTAAIQNKVNPSAFYPLFIHQTRKKIHLWVKRVDTTWSFRSNNNGPTNCVPLAKMLFLRLRHKRPAIFLLREWVIENCTGCGADV